MSWTNERVELLKKLWGEGQSASQIAKELGGVTRNAVIGKVHRLGLSNRATSTSKSETSPKSEKKSEKAPSKKKQIHTKNRFWKAKVDMRSDINEQRFSEGISDQIFMKT